MRLERENQAEELAEADKSDPKKRDTQLDARDVWERMNGKPGDLLHAGEFEQ